MAKQQNNAILYMAKNVKTWQVMANTPNLATKVPSNRHWCYGGWVTGDKSTI